MCKREIDRSQGKLCFLYAQACMAEKGTDTLGVATINYGEAKHCGYKLWRRKNDEIIGFAVICK